MGINPLLFAPSVRNIPEVIESWNKIPYDKYIVKMKPEPEAYKDGRDYFLDHEEYTHIVICPDDLVIDYDSFMMLVNDTEEYELSNISGVANIDENQPELYATKRLGVAPTLKHKSAHFTKQELDALDDEIMEVSFTGFGCQFIERELVKKLSFSGLNNTPHNLDQQMSLEMIELSLPLLINKNAFFYHMRNAQYLKVRSWKSSNIKPKGWSVLVKAGDIYEE
jgi:hypothetical protein